MSSFAEAFRAARAKGKREFSWGGNTYHTRMKGESQKAWSDKMSAGSKESGPHQGPNSAAKAAAPKSSPRPKPRGEQSSPRPKARPEGSGSKGARADTAKSAPAARAELNEGQGRAIRFSRRANMANRGSAPRGQYPPTAPRAPAPEAKRAASPAANQAPAAAAKQAPAPRAAQADTRKAPDAQRGGGSSRTVTASAKSSGTVTGEDVTGKNAGIPTKDNPRRGSYVIRRKSRKKP